MSLWATKFNPPEEAINRLTRKFLEEKRTKELTYATVLNLRGIGWKKMAYLLKEHYQNIPCERQRNNSSWSLNFAAQINCIFPIRCQKVKQSRGNYNLQPGPTQFCIPIGFQSISILDEAVGGNMQTKWAQNGG